MRRRMMRVMGAQQAAASAAHPTAPAPGTAAPAAPAAPAAEPYVLLGGDGSPVVKLKESDARRIQEEAGESPEDLEDSDLADSMRELGIQSLPLNNEDRKALGMPPVGPPTTAAPPPAAPAPLAATPAVGAAPSVEGQLKQYANLRDQGLISPEDYEAKKKQILGL